MAVVLTSSGVTFNDSTTLNSIYHGGFAQSSRSLMFRSSAPTGWSQITSHNNKAFRVVSGTGANSGGSNGFTSAFASRNVSGNAPVSTSFNLGNTSLSTNTTASHSHSYNGGGNSATVASPSPYAGNSGVTSPGGPSSGNQGSTSGHNHGTNSSSGGGSVSANQSFAVQYVNVIICNHS